MMCQHTQVHFRVRVPGEAAVTNLALLLRLLNGLKHAAGNENRVRFRVRQNLVHLPKVQVIGLQPTKRILQHGQGLFLSFLPLVVRANLGHQEHLIPLALQRGPHPFFRAPAGILPRIVKEGDTHINCGMGNAGGRLDRFRPGQRGPAQGERRHHLSMSPELALRNRPAGRAVGREHGWSITGNNHPRAGSAECFQETATMLFLGLVWHSEPTIPQQTRPAKPDLAGCGSAGWLEGRMRVALVALWWRFRVALVWLWCGFRVALGWLWGRNWLPTKWLWGGSVVALYSGVYAEYMPSIWLWGGFEMALGGFVQPFAPALTSGSPAVC